MAPYSWVTDTLKVTTTPGNACRSLPADRTGASLFTSTEQESTREGIASRLARIEADPGATAVAIPAADTFTIVVSVERKLMPRLAVEGMRTAERVSAAPPV